MKAVKAERSPVFTSLRKERKKEERNARVVQNYS